MKKLPKLQQEHKSLSLHVHMAEHITKHTRNGRADPNPPCGGHVRVLCGGCAALSPVLGGATRVPADLTACGLDLPADSTHLRI